MSEQRTFPQTEILKTGERREWRDVLRTYDVSFVGDLNGSFHGFLKNLLKLQYIQIRHKTTGTPGDINKFDDIEFSQLSSFLNEHTIQWTGKDARLIFLGDILGDRYGRGDIIISTIQLLQQQAKQDGGEIITLLGNHDAAAILTLATGDSLAGNLHPLDCTLEEYELFLEGTKQTVIGGKKIEYKTFQKSEMYTDEYIVNHINAIGKTYDIAVICDDSLFLHADILEDEFIHKFLRIETTLQSKNPKSQVTAQDVIREINSQFHSAFQAAFPLENNVINEKKQHTQALENLLLSPESLIYHMIGKESEKRQTRRGGYSEKFKKFLRERGINAFFHGHTRATQLHSGDDDFLTFSVDGSTNRENLNDDNYSCGTIRQTGEVCTHILKETKNYRTDTSNI